MDPLTAGTLIGVGLTAIGTWLGYKSYKRGEALNKVIVEADAHLNSKKQAQMTIVVRNHGDESIILERIRADKPHGAQFVKETKDGYREMFLVVQERLAPKGQDPKQARFQLTREPILRLPDGRAKAGTKIVIAARCGFTTSIDKSGWVSAKTVIIK
jgi:hypothetical protein